jgi:hypothetical protein
MKIGDRYQVTSETNNIVVSEKRVNQETGAEYWVNAAYFGTVENALKYLVQMEVEKSELQDLQTVLNRINGIGASINKALADQIAKSLGITE